MTHPTVDQTSGVAPETAAVIDAVFRATVEPLPAEERADAADPEAVAVFRETMGAFPTAVSIVTALDDAGAPRGLTCSAVCSLSAAPPTLLVCVNRRNGSLAAIRHSEGFVVNLLRAQRSDLSDRFASPSPDKYDGVSWRPSPASGLPLLHDDTLAHADCRLVADIEAGSHAILIGRLRTGASAPAPAEPLLYWRRSYGSWQSSDDPTPQAAGQLAPPASSSDPAPPPSPTRRSPAVRAPSTQGPTMHRDQIADELERYIRTAFLDGDDDDLSRSTPLLQWGVLNSMNTALLLTHIRDHLGVVVPPTELNGANFRDIDSIADLVSGLVAVR